MNITGTASLNLIGIVSSDKISDKFKIAFLETYSNSKYGRIYLKSLNFHRISPAVQAFILERGCLMPEYMAANESISYDTQMWILDNHPAYYYKLAANKSIHKHTIKFLMAYRQSTRCAVSKMLKERKFRYVEV